MLNAHPAIACGPESSLFVVLSRRDQQRVLRDPAWPKRAERFLRTWRTEALGSILDAYGVRIEDARTALARSEPSARALLEAITIPYATARGKERWAEKTPRHLLHGPRIRELWPDALFVRIVRDPRAVALSLSRMHFGPSTPVGSAYVWALQDDEAHAFFKRDTGSITTRFEDLVADPAMQLRRICDHIGEPFDKAMLEPGEEARTLAPVGSARRETLGRPLDPARATAWRDELDATDQHRIATICADGIERYGYAGAIRPLLRVSMRVLDGVMLDDPTVLDVLARSADARIVYERDGRPVRDATRPTALWGAPGQLRWSSGGRLATARSLFSWAMASAARRLRGRPVLWVDARVSRSARRSIGEKVGDIVARSTTRRIRPGELVTVLSGDRSPATGRGAEATDPVTAETTRNDG